MTSLESKLNNTPPDWPGEKIVLNDNSELDKLLSEGYEMVDRYFHYSAQQNKKGELESKITCRLLLKKDELTLNANSDLLGLYPMQWAWLYDFEKKRPVATYMTDQSLHTELETIIIDLLAPRFRKPFKIEKHQFNDNQKIYQHLYGFVKNEQNQKYVGIPKLNLSDLFSKTIVVTEKGNKIDFDIFSKEQISLKDVKKIKTDASSFDNCVVLSFFYLTKKISKDNDFNDVLVGMILYDIKNKKTLCFSIVSSSYFYQSHVKNKGVGLYDVALSIFEESIDKQMVCKSFPPTTIDHPWYTPLPWIYYAVLLPIELDNNLPNTIDEIRKISVPEYFTFGIPKWPANSSCFVFDNFSSFKNGRATCIFDFNAEKRITYPLRFDQSAGEPLVHLDFAFHDGKENKLIAHRQLDLESVSSFSLPLYGCVLAAGYFDGYFSTIIKKGIRGVEELRQKNAAYLYPLKFMWEVETAIIWLDENGGYEILEKANQEERLTDEELRHVKKMSDNHLTLVAKDHKEDFWGLTPIGYMVLHRNQSGQKEFSLNS